MKKKLLLLFAILAMAVNASADNTVISYTATAAITPTSDAFKDANGNKVNFENSYADGKGTLTFNGVVTEIGANASDKGAFDECTTLTSITIGSSVETIGESAFNYCRGLTSVSIPSSVKTIGKQAFYYCDKLDKVTDGGFGHTQRPRPFFYWRQNSIHHFLGRDRSLSPPISKLFDFEGISNI